MTQPGGIPDAATFQAAIYSRPNRFQGLEGPAPLPSTSGWPYERSQWGSPSTNLWPDHFRKAALALHLIDLHPFNDGQKRTGFQMADNILRMNGILISSDKERICSMLCRIAEYNCTLDAIEKWLRENTQEI